MKRAINSTRGLTPFEIVLWLGVGFIAIIFACLLCAFIFGEYKPNPSVRFRNLANSACGFLFLGSATIIGLVLRWGPIVPMSVLTPVVLSLFIPNLSSSYEESVWNDFRTQIMGVVLGAISGILIDAYLNWKSVSEPFEQQNY